MPAVAVMDSMKKKIVLDELLEKGWTHTQDGRAVHDLSYDELKSELVLLAFREIDTECAENIWF